MDGYNALSNKFDDRASFDNVQIQKNKTRIHGYV